MDLVVAIAEVFLGVLLIVVSLGSAFRTVILPRASFDPLTRSIFLGLRSLLLWLSRHTPHLDRETVLSVHAPLGLFAMALAWATGIICGFTFLFLASGDLDARESFVLAGSSFTTLGFAPPLGWVHALLAILAAILGLGVVALLISYLPMIYGLFSTREVTVADVSIKSGGVAHGPDLVLHLTRIADTTRLDDMWVEWGHWLITLGETHTSEPSLNFFRSPRANRSWLTGATAILDAAVLRNTLVAAPFSVRAEMTYRAGLEALAEIGHFFYVAPSGGDGRYTLLTREDFDTEVERLVADGIPVVDDIEEAWREFVKMRKAYEPHVIGMARLISPPPAPWSSDLLERVPPPLPSQGEG